MSVAPPLAALTALRHPAGRAGASPEALLQRQTEIEVAVALAEFVDPEIGLCAVGNEQQPIAVSRGAEGIVEIKRDRRSRSRAIFDERGPVWPAVIIGVEFVGPEESGFV